MQSFASKLFAIAARHEPTNAVVAAAEVFGMGALMS